MPRKKIIKQEDTGYEYYRTYLNKGIQLLDSMSRRHRRVMQTRMDFRYPQEMEIDGSNRDFSRALRDLTKELRKDGYDPQYIGRREQKDQPHQHYHLTLMTNAKKNECRQGIIERAERHWGNALGMTRDEVREKQLVYPCNRDEDGNPRPNGYTLTRGTGNYKETRSKMIGQMSYLTKHVDADTTPSTTRKFFVSQYRREGGGTMNLLKGLQKGKNIQTT